MCCLLCNDSFACYTCVCPIFDLFFPTFADIFPFSLVFQHLPPLKPIFFVFQTLSYKFVIFSSHIFTLCLIDLAFTPAYNYYNHSQCSLFKCLYTSFTTHSTLKQLFQEYTLGILATTTFFSYMDCILPNMYHTCFNYNCHIRL